MHDPMTVAFKIPRPWPERSKLGGGLWWPAMITIWHVDPETDGTDDSCDWFHYNLSPDERAAALDLMTSEFDNLNIFYRGMDSRDQELVMLAEWRAARRYYAPRPWWKHPRWHIWHWRIQIPVIQDLQRYLFSRCAKCGKRFAWGYSPIGPWSGTGPRWFRGEAGVYHHECDCASVRLPDA